MIVSDKLLKNIEEYRKRNLLSNKMLADLIERNVTTLYILKKRKRIGMATLRRLQKIGVKVD